MTSRTHSAAAQLQDLLSRVTKAEGPDRELSFAIAKALLVPKYDGSALSWFGWGPHYTASVDAALALVERVLPGWSKSVVVISATETEAYVWPHGDVSNFQGTHRLPALALLAALLSALSQQTEEVK